jgi:hypothetical protein
MFDRVKALQTAGESLRAIVHKTGFNFAQTVFDAYPFTVVSLDYASVPIKAGSSGLSFYQGCVGIPTGG